MAASPSTAPQGVTFGVELEIIVPYLCADQKDPAGDTDARRVIRLSEEDMKKVLSPTDLVKNNLRDFLRAHDVDVSGRYIPEARPPTQWSVGSDSTVRETRFTDYRWAGVEIRSPALLAEAGSFEEVKRVVSLLRNNFRLRLNQSAGFHVHVGVGAQRLPPRAVRRLSQFLWCADGILSQLHPPERMLSQFCPSIRHTSYLAQGRLDHWVGAEEELVGVGEMRGRTSPIDPAVDHEDPEAVSSRLSVLQQDGSSSPALDARSGPPRLQRLPPVRASPYQDEGARRRHHVYWGVELTPLTRREFLGRDMMHPHEMGMARLEPAAAACTSALDGLRFLCRPEAYANTARAVDELSNVFGQRFGYNLSAYGFHDFGELEVRMTVEFREAAGSFSPSWVAAWARICSRIVEFCLEADEDVFVEVLMRVLEAEVAFEADGGRPRYDVVDLLVDFDLPDEAKLVEDRILTGDKNIFWFPCALAEDAQNSFSGASTMLPPGED